MSIISLKASEAKISRGEKISFKMLDYNYQAQQKERNKRQGEIKHLYSSLETQILTGHRHAAWLHCLLQGKEETSAGEKVVPAMVECT